MILLFLFVQGCVVGAASLSTLSPNTNMFRVGSRLRAWNIASVATGSTADMRDPNVKLTDKREREKNYL